jgi:hypothetical protein
MRQADCGQGGKQRGDFIQAPEKRARRHLGIRVHASAAKKRGQIIFKKGN